MSTNDLQQYAFFTVVAAVALLALLYIFIKSPQARATELAPWAQKRGLRFTPPRSLGSHTTGMRPPHVPPSRPCSRTACR